MTVDELESIRATTQPLIMQSRYDDVDLIIQHLRGTEDPLAQAYCHHVDGLRKLDEESASESIEHFERALELYLSASYQDGIASMYLNLGNAYGRQWNEAEALKWANKGLSIAESMNDQQFMAMFLQNIGSYHRGMFNYDAAIEYTRRSLHIFQDLADPANECIALQSLAALYYRISDDRAVATSERAREIAHEQGMRQLEWVTLVQLFDHFFGHEKYEEATDHLSQMETIVRTLPDGQSRVITLHRRVILASRLGNLEEAATALSALESAGWPDGPHIARLAQARGHYLMAIGDLNSARDELEAAVQGFQDFDDEVQLEKCYAELQEVAKKLGDFDLYVKHAEAAKASFERLHDTSRALRVIAQENELEMRHEREDARRHRDALYATLPQHVAERVVRGEVVNDHYDNATVLFLDLVGFTTLSSDLSPSELVRILESIFKEFDEVCKAHDVTKVKTIGDAYLAIATGDGHQQRMALTAIEMMKHASSLDKVSARIGVHCGPLVAGVVGTERLQYDVWGDTVNVASRMESTSEPGRIHATEAFANSLALGAWHLVRRGETDIKGKGHMTTFWLEQIVQ